MKVLLRVIPARPSKGRQCFVCCPIKMVNSPIGEYKLGQKDIVHASSLFSTPGKPLQEGSGCKEATGD